MQIQRSWIRTPYFDSFWILSGLPFGFLLFGLTALLPLIFVQHLCVFLFNSGHLFSPIVLGWSHSDFRELMLKSRLKYIFTPLTIVLATTAIGYYVGLHLEVAAGQSEDALMQNLIINPNGANHPLVLILQLYLLWNAYHFAAQDFGILSLYRAKSEKYDSKQRKYDKFFCYLTGFLMMPAIIYTMFHLNSGSKEVMMWRGGLSLLLAIILTTIMIRREFRFSTKVSRARIIYVATKGFGVLFVMIHPLIGFAIYSLNHWLVSIGLSSHIFSVNKMRTHSTPRWFHTSGVFASAMVLLSVTYTVFLSLVSHNWSFDSFSLNTLSFHMTAAALGSRLGLGFVHFLYDRYLFKFSRSEVRNTIGKDLILPEIMSGHGDSQRLNKAAMA